MTTRAADSRSEGTSSWLGLGSCILGAVAAFVWLPDSIWGSFLPSFPSKLFPPMFATAFAAGWVVGLWRLKTGKGEQEGAIRSHAAITGILTALIAIYVAHTASSEPRGASLPFGVAAAFLALGLLPCAMFATIGASFAHPGKDRRGTLAHVASAILPVVAIFVWPVVYGVGKFLEKPRVATTHIPAPVMVLAPSPPEPRYVKPEGFDDSHAWKRIIASQEVIRNADHSSSCVLSLDERRLAFVKRDGGVYRLAIRHLYDPGPDYSLQTASAISALAWSPDDRRIIFLATGTGLFWVCEPVSGRMIPLPIPKVDANAIAGLAWWKEEEVAVTFKRGETQMLSLATLKLMPVGEKDAWTKLGETERKAALRKQSLNASGKVGYEVQFDGPKTVLAAQDVETAYARVLTTDLGKNGDAFATRDGSIVFLLEEDHLRVLYMGLRDAPALRFVGEATDEFPTETNLSEALAKRAIRAVVAAPIVNPLNGKTVAGDASRIKGYARLISANDKSSTVWIEQEHEPIREGDVLIALSAIQGADEFSVSRDWWAILTKPDTNQSIPRRADVPSRLPSPTRVLRPMPEPTSPSSEQQTKGLAGSPQSRAASTAAVVPPEKMTPSEPNVSAQQPAVAKKPTASMAPTESSQPRIPVFAEKDVQKFIIGHHSKFSRRDLNAFARDYSEHFQFDGLPARRAQMIEMSIKNWAIATTVTEVVLGPIDVKRLGEGRFSATYRTSKTYEKSGRTPVTKEAGWQLEVVSGSEGLQIAKQTFVEPSRLGGASR